MHLIARGCLGVRLLRQLLVPTRDLYVSVAPHEPHVCRLGRLPCTLPCGSAWCIPFAALVDLTLCLLLLLNLPQRPTDSRFAEGHSAVSITPHMPVKVWALRY